MFSSISYRTEKEGAKRKATDGWWQKDGDGEFHFFVLFSLLESLKRYTRPLQWLCFCVLSCRVVGGSKAVSQVLVSEMQFLCSLVLYYYHLSQCLVAFEVTLLEVWLL